MKEACRAEKILKKEEEKEGEEGEEEEEKKKIAGKTSEEGDLG